MAAQPTDESKASTLPDPELNPLLNPLLAAHMGRWAEVYFTSPPEKRAQAVSNLVRELANNSTPEPVSSPPVSFERDSSEPVWGKVDDESDENPPPGMHDAIDEPVIHCESCGHQNAPQQRFCGMCGTPLPNSSEDSSQQSTEAQPIAAPAWEESDTLPSPAPEREIESDAGLAPYIENDQARESLPWPPAEDSPAEFHGLSGYQSDTEPHSYRIYIGAAVVILLGLLVYMTWRSNTALRSSGTAPSTLPQAVSPPKTEPATAAELPEIPAQPNAKVDAALAAAPTVSASQSKNGTGARSDKDRRADRRIKSRPAPRVVPVTSSSPTGAAGQNGSAELAAAEKYLNAEPGTVRDSRQASTWLWKAVAKQNVAATLLLSDLYLRGDGVTKSCDQARLLLDAAARKGATAAADRLRNLQAFGCR